MTYNNWAEISKKALVNNLKKIRDIANPKAKIMTLVKANAYGHGMVEVAKILLENGADYLAVARINEGIALRQEGIKAPILILSYTFTDLCEDLIKYNLTQTVYSLDYATKLNENCLLLKGQVKIHLKVDTGMGRIGFMADSKEVMEEAFKISKLDKLEIEGIYTHFAKADELDEEFTFKQFNRFMAFIKALENKGLKIPLRHCANSATTLRYPKMHLDMVRPGIILYGLYPSNDVDYKISLEPVMSIKALVVMVKKVPKDFYVGYSCKYKTASETKIATLALGYGDGYIRAFSGADVLIGGKRFPIIGKICMDQCMVDIGNESEIKIGDEAVFVGQQGKENISAEELAQKIGSISYEVVTLLENRVPRIYRD